MSHNPDNQKCPWNDPETYCNPVVSVLPCKCFDTKIVIMYGIPGSGKSHYAEQQKKLNSWKYKIVIVDMDKNIRYYKNIDKSIDVTVQDIFSTLYGYNAKMLIVDGLITTNEILRKLLKGIKEHPEFKKNNIEFLIVWWQEDRETCAYNDQGRRSENSLITIKNAPFEPPSQELIDEFNILKENVMKKKVEKKPKWKVWAHEHGLGDKETFESNSWSLGGTSGDYYNDGLTQINAQPQPTAFKEFDDLLLNICPNIGFLQYKKIYNETITIKTESYDDYFGGSENQACFVCDIIKLYNELLLMGLILDED